ncbi:MAG: TerB family tellurite resistance protein [Cyanobacteriota bacterium]|nr:TerB family tellurite resistance protein [Cyanobacteriota bacterium]
MVSPPPPPSITPRQMDLLRIVASMAWSDGQLATEEVDLMLKKFSSLFAKGDRQLELQQELRDYMMQNIPLEELIPKLTTKEEKELVLQLGYEVIACSSRTPEEAKINEDEEIAYKKLVALLDLPEETVKRLEEEAEFKASEGIVDKMTRKIQEFMET